MKDDELKSGTKNVCRKKKRNEKERKCAGSETWLALEQAELIRTSGEKNVIMPRQCDAPRGTRSYVRTPSGARFRRYIRAFPVIGHVSEQTLATVMHLRKRERYDLLVGSHLIWIFHQVEKRGARFGVGHASSFLKRKDNKDEGKVSNRVYIDLVIRENLFERLINNVIKSNDKKTKRKKERKHKIITLSEARSVLLSRLSWLPPGRGHEVSLASTNERDVLSAPDANPGACREPTPRNSRSSTSASDHHRMISSRPKILAFFSSFHLPFEIRERREKE